MEEKDVIQEKENYGKVTMIASITLIIITVFCFLFGVIFDYQNTNNQGRYDELQKIVNTNYYDYLSKASKAGEINQREIDNAQKKYEESLKNLENFTKNANIKEVNPFYKGGIFFLIVSFVAIFIYLYFSKMQITVTTARVYGRKRFGVMVNIPLDSILKAEVSFLNGIDITTTSEKIHFKGIKNNNKINTEINRLLNDRKR